MASDAHRTARARSPAFGVLRRTRAYMTYARQAPSNHLFFAPLGCWYLGLHYNTFGHSVCRPSVALRRLRIAETTMVEATHGIGSGTAARATSVFPPGSAPTQYTPGISQIGLLSSLGWVAYVYPRE